MSAPATIRLEVEGMTCAGCVARVERSLNALPGVDASVNLVTEQAAVAFDPARAGVGDLVAAVRSTGYEARPAGEPVVERPVRDARLLVAAVLSAPLLVVSMLPALQFDGWEWLALALATPVVLWSGLPFHRAALLNLRHGAATMDTLVSLGTLAAYGWSVVALLLLDGAHVYFEVAAVITTLLLLGRSLERRARRRSGEAVRRLAELGAKDAHVLRDGVEELVPVAALRPGDRFVVRPGEQVATDGIVEEGASEVDRSLLTGESVPVGVGPGDEVEGAILNGSGRLVVRATRVGADTALARIGRLVAEAQAGKASVQRLADRVASVFVPVVLVLALATLVGQLVLTGDAGAAFEASIAVLIIACPCALGLATPAALVVGTGRGAQLGIVIRGPEALEATRRVTTVVLDKTGTVTDGNLRLIDVVPLNGADRDEVLRLAGAVEDGSEHPVGRAIAAAARAELGPVPGASDFRSTAGAGVAATVEGLRVEVGRGRDGVEVRWGSRARARLVLADTLKPTSAEAVAGLRRLGLDPILMTGDTEAAARAVAAELGLERVLAGVLPEGKAAEIARLQAAGETVAMVGDGVNDAPALARADLGIALGSGSDVAIEASDLTLTSGDLRAAVDAIRLARRTLRTIHVNLFWAFAYNVAAIPLAVAGLLDPIVAAAAMACSSLFVVGNSLRLRRFRSIRPGVGA